MQTRRGLLPCPNCWLGRIAQSSQQLQQKLRRARPLQRERPHLWRRPARLGHVRAGGGKARVALQGLPAVLLVPVARELGLWALQQHRLALLLGA